MTPLIVGRIVFKPEAVFRLKITDRYSLHRLMLQLVELERDEDAVHHGNLFGGLQWVDRGEKLEGRVVDFLTTLKIRKTSMSSDIELSYRPLPDHFLDHEFYRFQVVVNPVTCSRGRRFAIDNESDILEWFSEKLHIGGVDCGYLQVDQRGRDIFWKGSQRLVYARARISGVLKVRDHQLFVDTFTKGIGKGRAFGFGFLQLKII